MQLTPAQIGVLLICGENPGNQRVHSVQECIRQGHEFLVRITGRDFGYDLQAWHDHLKESREGGYTYGRNIELPRIMKRALQSLEWRDAVESLKK